MNKIFMTKKNTHGQTVVCSEKTRTRGKMSALVLAVAASMAGVAHAELVNTSTAFQATQETGETASGYLATTQNPNTVANGFSTNAQAQGSIAIGAESGTSGSGLLPQDAQVIATTGKEFSRIDAAIAAISQPEYVALQFQNAKDNMYYPDPAKYPTAQAYIDYQKDVMKATGVLQSIRDTLGFALPSGDYTNRAGANYKGFSESKDYELSYESEQGFLSDQQEIAKRLTAVKQGLDSSPLLANTPEFVEISKHLDGAIQSISSATALDDIKNMPKEQLKALSDLLQNAHKYQKGFSDVIAKQIKPTSDTIRINEFWLVNDESKNRLDTLANDINQSMLDAVAAGESPETAATNIIASMREEDRIRLERLKEISTFISDEMKEALSFDAKYYSVTEVFRDDAFAPNKEGTSNAFMDGAVYKYRLGMLKTVDALKAAGVTATPDEIMRAYFAYIQPTVKSTHSNRFGSDSGVTTLGENYIARVESEVQDYIEKKKNAIAQAEQLESEKTQVMGDFAEVAKKLGYDNPTPETLQEVLGSLSPNAIAIGRKAYTSGGSAVGVGAESVVTGNMSVSVGANNNVFADKVTVLGANINVVKDAPVGSVVIGEGSQVAIAEPSENITIASVKYDFAGTAPQSAVSVGSVGKERQIKNVAAGVVSAASTDAINGSQLYALAEAVAAISAPNETNITGTPDITVNSTTKDGVTTHVIGLSDPIKAQIAKEESVSAGANIIVKQDKLNETGGKNFEVSLSGNLTNISSITNAGKPISFGGSRLTDVADPINDGDAVNKGYLDKSIQDVKDSIVVTTVSAADDGVTVNKNGNDYAVGLSDKTKATLADVEKLKPQVASNKADIEKLKPQVAQNTADIENLKPRVAKNEADIAKNTADIETNRANIAKGLNFKTQDDVTTNKQLGDTVTVLGDSNIKTSTAGGNIIVGLNQDIKVNSIRLGDTITANTQGINMGGQGITGLKPGVVAAGSTDAINGDQLFNMGNDIKNYIGGIEDGLEAGLAGSRAVAALPQTHTSGKSMLAVAMGSYRDKGAVAVGFSRLSDNGRTTLKLNLDATTEKTFGAGVGIGYEF